MTSKTASGPAARAARAIAGAVLRAPGSTRIRASSMAAAARSATTCATYAAPHTIIGGAKPVRAAARARGWRNKLFSPNNGRAACGERRFAYVLILVVAGKFKKKNTMT